MRTVMALVSGLALLAACSGLAGEPPPMPEARIGTLNLNCAGETFRVAFLDTHAGVVSADGATTVELPKLAATPTSEPGVAVYTDGRQTFAKSGGGDTATVIRFARARMGFQDCAIAQN